MWQSNNLNPNFFFFKRIPNSFILMIDEIIIKYGRLCKFVRNKKLQCLRLALENELIELVWNDVICLMSESQVPRWKLLGLSLHNLFSASVIYGASLFDTCLNYRIILFTLLLGFLISVFTIFNIVLLI